MDSSAIIEATPHSGLPEGQENPDAAEISDIWRIFWFRRRWLAAGALLLALAALCFGLVTPPLYAATAQVLVDPRGRQVLANDVNPVATAPDGGVTQVESQSKVLGSSGVLLRAIAALKLTNDPEFNGTGGMLHGLAAGLKRLARLDTAAPSEARRQAAALTGLRRRLAVKRADKAFVIDVTVTTRDGEKSADIVNAILDAYAADGAQAQFDAAIKASASLSAGLAEQRGTVREAADAVAAFKARHGLLEANDRLVNDGMLAELSLALGDAKAKTAQSRARLQRVNGSAAEATSEAMRSATISELRAQEAALAQSRSELRQELGPRHPALRKADAQAAALRQSITRELARLARASRTELDRAQAYEDALAGRFEAMKAAKMESDRAFVGLRELERELDARRTVYSAYLQRASETREQAGVDSSNIRIISRAVAPGERSWPPTGLLAAVAFAGGLGLAAAGALLREYVAPTILSRAQMQRVAGAWNLGVIPVGARRARLRLPFEGGGAERQRMETAVALTVNRLGGESGANGRSILVASGAGEDADRRAVSRLAAAAAAMQGLRVLFVDAVSSGQAGTPQPGLLDVLDGERPFAAAVLADPRSPIALLGYGRTAEAGSGAARGGAARGGAARRLLAEAALHFDLIVIDGGVLAESAPASPLAGAADEVILAATLGRTPQAAVASALRTLGALGRRPSATLLFQPVRGL